jgi:hypothetical protein
MSTREEGLEQRLGFHPNLGVLFHVAGVTFEGRQQLLRRIQHHCTYSYAPPVELREASDDDRNKFGDPNAVEVWAGVEQDELSGEWQMVMIGYVPRRGCGSCGANYGGKWLDLPSCPKCGSQHILEPNVLINQMMQQDTITAAMDGVNEKQSGRRTNLGCVVYVKKEE